MQKRLPIKAPARYERVVLPLYRKEKHFMAGAGFQDALDNRAQDMLELVFESRAWRGKDNKISWRWVCVTPVDMTLDDEIAWQKHVEETRGNG